VVALDLDGTVIDSQGSISERFCELVARLDRCGIRSVICTGRRWRTARPIVEQIEKAHPIVVCCGGALIKQGQTHQTLRSIELCEAIARKTTLLYREAGLIPMLLYDRDLEERELLIPAEDEERARERLYIQRNIETVEFYDGDLPTGLGPPLEVYTVDDVSLVRGAEPRLRRELGDRGFVTALHQPRYPADQWVIQVHSARATKWNALRWLLDRWTVAPDRVVAIGDDVNDVPMLEAAGLSFAMGNAVPAARDAADRTTGSNDEDGVAIALEKTFSSLCP
jgi:hypothetical protein